MNVLRAIVFLLLGLSFGVSAQVSPFNGRMVLPADSAQHYRILVGGHFHGSSYSRSGYPAATLLAQLDTVNALSPNVFISTGDLFLSADADSARYMDSFFKRIEVPLFNVPGNHDMEGDVYKRSFGPNFSSFELGGDLFILLDTELDNGKILGEQLTMFRSRMASFAGKHIFIFSHRPIWSEDNDTYSSLFQGNTRAVLGNNFTSDIYPQLQQKAKEAEIYWISGSVAGRAPSSIFFQEHEHGLTYIQCAVREEPRDALLLADISPEGVIWKAISLTGQKLNGPSTYNVEYWRKNQGKREKFNWRLLPYLLKITVSGAEFWYGFGVAALLIVVVRWLFRRFL